MSTDGFDHLYIETHDFAAALRFWQALGFELEYDTGHGSGALRNPAGATTVFLAEQSLEDPLASELYLRVAADYHAPEGVHVVAPFHDTHWGTKVMIVQDPDGHRFRLEAPR